MKGFLKRINRDSRGFTLIELLVVVAILGVLAAIVLPNFTGLVDKGELEGAAAEKATVQIAMDTMMTVNSLGSVSVVTTGNATNDMADFPDDTYPLYPSYMRYQLTQGTYSCDNTGLIKQESSGY